MQGLPRRERRAGDERLAGDVDGQLADVVPQRLPALRRQRPLPEQRVPLVGREVAELEREQGEFGQARFAAVRAVRRVGARGRRGVGVQAVVPQGVLDRAGPEVERPEAGEQGVPLAGAGLGQLFRDLQ